MENTAKNFAIQLGSLVALYVSVVAIISTIFGLITIIFPDAADSFYVARGADSQIKFSIATLIVSFPTYILLTRIVNVSRRNELSKYLTLTKWLIYLSLLIGGAVLLGDLIAVIHAYLNGDLALRFALKALTVFVIVSGAFTYYSLDVKGYWQMNERKSITYGAVVAALVLLTIIFGFFNIQAPSEVRERKIDQNQINDLSEIDRVIQNYYTVNNTTPDSLEEAYGEITIPTSPDSRLSYEYEAIHEREYKLCAEFAYPSDDDRYSENFRLEEKIAFTPTNWEHKSGWWCFTRSIQAREIPRVESVR